jgi:acyl-CoA synthetase (AMP-forming)/AMP-acid ligase II
MTLFALLDRTAARWPGEGAVYLGDRALQSWHELRGRASALGASLRSLAPAGTRIALASENAPQYLELLFGAWAAGWVVVPINFKLHAKEVAQICEDAEPALLFASEALAPHLRAVALDPVVIGSTQYEALFGTPAGPLPETSPEQLAWLFYTSGTTGRSKGAMLSQRNLMAMTLAHLADVERIDRHSSQIHAAPMSHGSGLYIPAYVACGAKQVIPESRGFDPAEFLRLCDTHRGCGAFLAPTMVQRLRLAAEASAARPRNLRSIVYGGGPMYVEELKKALATFGDVFVQIYGQGESPMTITWLPRGDHASGDEHVLGSVGIARTGVEVRVVGDDGRELPAGDTGEVICRGDVVMAGYWRNPEGTESALRDGWLYTGDVGSLDEGGYLTLRDRSKDVVISGGSNIYPREVEEALLAHPDVLECGVVGQPDPEWGEVVIAFVVAVPDSKLTPHDLDGYCLDRIARFKRPKRYVFIDALPKNSYGKVLKRELRERLTHQDSRRPA